ncbi:MAG: acyl-CoA dehydrogenase [Candidatus Competibacteraceae bacterium]|uniref:3-methylmercaptopropionyl-CoA dehydrogenase n=1 Tax=Candidatus Contendobacter odensis Run_B_J11 TaxID=1400861 RepID=A0A7U7GAK8_9GAMM|nr:acyl-CoA dehydrogenase [Candidatus Contendobacter odensis]MBK8537069.1 acyl-CoA dehydrogenase [Candidatus Competibacteraceae bacterium]MBK8754431.1 acyl-CoA dehydrogenase [Candidatus Competibacteraceae bacterium]CDH44915.1 putative acyl-CoA dehydrogenase [Candidatus Contendobacter odensis Run_B_J11]
MTTYSAPTRDMQFVINELAGLAEVAALPAFAEQEIGPGLLEAVLEEAAKLATEVLAPLNKVGDIQGARMSPQGVIPADGFAEAYQQFVEGGWNGIGCSTEFGGQGLPEIINTATQEMWNSANMSFALCPLLNAGAIEAIRHAGSAEQKALYLPKMISGEWTGTMNLTESQAGSDLSAVRTRAVPEGDHYRLFGQKIFITWGEHNMTPNTVHLVLARTPDAPEGVKGISLFIVPKFLINPDGSLGARNDVNAVSIEHKLGIHASPTCVMAFGDQDGAVGYRVGEENKGLVYMFIMMNEARFKVGLQGLAIAKRAYQAAREYARDRVQGRPVGAKSGERVTIIHHPDVRRMLMLMKSQNEAMRALAYVVAGYMDLARYHPDAAIRKIHQARVDLLIPVVKGWFTEIGIEIASLGVQVHGGMGFIEETGACQHLRDSRITTIYEGTTGIQAADLAGRKLSMDQGAAMRALITEMGEVAEQLGQAPGDDMAAIRTGLGEGVRALAEATQWILDTRDANAVMAVSVDYLMLAGTVCGGWQMARAAQAAQRKLRVGEDLLFHEAKLVSARFYAEHVLPKTAALLISIRNGGVSIMALTAEQF